MEVTPLCLLPNQLHLYIRTQRGFILIQIELLHMTIKAEFESKQPRFVRD